MEKPNRIARKPGVLTPGQAVIFWTALVLPIATGALSPGNVGWSMALLAVVVLTSSAIASFRNWTRPDRLAGSRRVL